MLLWHILEDRDASRVKPLCIVVLLEQTDQFTTLLADFVIEDQFFIKRRLSLAFWVFLDFYQVGSDVNSRSDAVSHALTVLLCPLQIHIHFVVDAPMPTLLYLDERDLASLHHLEAILQERQVPLVVHDKVIRDFSLLIQVN